MASVNATSPQHRTLARRALSCAGAPQTSTRRNLFIISLLQNMNHMVNKLDLDNVAFLVQYCFIIVKIKQCVHNVNTTLIINHCKQCDT